ncbi:MAG: protein translocase subunit SecD [Saprospiraceae bacterium]|nr:protein translocase subunit SecD [Saprospiraceae bacterium]
MQGKGLLKAFLILMSIVCLIQLFYFFPTSKVERAAEDYATTTSASKSGLEKDMAFKMARAKYLDSMSTEKIFNVPLLGVGYTYSDLKQRQLNLGLDLKGGMSTLLEVDLSELLNALAGRNSKDSEFVQAIANAKKAQENDQSNFISLFVAEYKKIAGGKPMARLFAQSESLGGNINLETSDNEVERLLRERADQTVDLTFKMLKERIDRLGVVQPNISLDKARDLILVEMPGIDNPERARQFLQKNAQLEFWETYRLTDAGIQAGLQQADLRLSGDTSAVAAAQDTSALKTGGPLLSILKMNNPTAPTAPITVVGLADKNKKDAVMAMLGRPDIQALFPKNLKFMWSYKPHQDFNTQLLTNQYELYAIKTTPGSDKAPLDGEVVTDASATQDQVTGEPQVSLIMNAIGAKKWAELTQKAYEGNPEGQRREIAIALDNEVVTAPSVNNGAITGGSSVISGSFNVQETVDLSNILEVGKLPAKTKIIQESNVGPSLGKSNIDKSLNSLLIGFGLVMLFMVLYYSGAGIISILALFANIIFILGALSSFGTVLTLPGIAGIVLTIGMAVDANVIIYERIKEELRSGKSLLDAIKDGFNHSYSAIVDANVTTIITALLLAYFGIGPIKGFRVVLTIGVLSSMLTAVLLAHLLIDGYVAGGKRNLTFWNAGTKDTLSSLSIDWVGKRKYAYIFSGTLIVVGLISIFTRGFDLGVDFQGGHSFNVQFEADQKVTADDLRNKLTANFEATPVVKIVDTENTFNITTSYLINENEEGTEEKVTSKLFEGLKSIVSSDISYEQFKAGDAPGMKLLSSSKVGPTVADDIKKSSVYAGLFALMAIFLYILFRFSRWQYSAGAVIAVFHDALITIGMFSLLKGIVPFSLEIDQAFIAAILTVIGYSINDTVIVFDRIREYMGIYGHKSQGEIINNAINKTFSRTTFTSLTTLFVVIGLFLFGGASIKGFAFALLVGIVIGTYSSIFVATPLMIDLGGGRNKKPEVK